MSADEFIKDIPGSNYYTRDMVEYLLKDFELKSKNEFSEFINEINNVIKDTKDTLTMVKNQHKYHILAQHTSTCMIDLSENLANAYSRYMKQEITSEEYSLILSRHGKMLKILHELGY